MERKSWAWAEVRHLPTLQADGRSSLLLGGKLIAVGVRAPERVSVAKRHQGSGLQGGCVEGPGSYLNARAASVLARLSASVPDCLFLSVSAPVPPAALRLSVAR